MSARPPAPPAAGGGVAPMDLTIATRRSPLALAQTGLIASALTELGHRVEVLPLVTTGDRWSAAGGGAAPTRGLFVKELEEALLSGRADLAVHSAKDLPAELPEGLMVAAVPPREDPRDVLVGVAGGLGALPQGARVGTGSPRRSAQLRAARPDVEVVAIRGNVGTRLERLDGGELEAIILAAAGLRRLGLRRSDASALDVGLSTPAPGQGLLALETRAEGAAASAVAALDDRLAHACLRAERALLRGLGGGCMQPVGALARPHEGNGLELLAFAGSEDGLRHGRARRVGPLAEAEALGEALAAELAGVRA